MDIFTNPAAGSGGTGTSLNPYNSAAQWPAAHTIQSGNRYFLKRGQRLLVQTQIVSQQNASAMMELDAYYNSDGSDDANQPKPLISSAYQSNSSHWTYDGTPVNSWRKTGAGEFYGHLVMGANDSDPGTWGEERDQSPPYDKSTNAPNQNPMVGVGDWDYVTEGTDGQKVLSSGSAAADNPGTKWAPMLAYLTGQRYQRFAVRFNQPDAGFVCRNIRFEKNWGALCVHLRENPGVDHLTPSILIENCDFYWNFNHFATRGGSRAYEISGTPTNDTVVVGTDGMIIQDCQFHHSGEAAITKLDSAWTTNLNGRVQRNVISNACWANANGAIYVQYHRNRTGDRTKDWIIQLNSISKTAYGRGNWPEDGMDMYTEWVSGGVQWIKNVCWGSHKGGNVNPYAESLVGPVLFKWCILIGTGLDTAMGLLVSGPIGAGPQGNRKCQFQSLAIKGYNVGIQQTNSYNTNTYLEIRNIWFKGTTKAGANSGSAVLTGNTVAGTRIAPIDKIRAYNLGSGATGWASFVTTDVYGGGGSLAAGDRASVANWVTDYSTANQDAIMETAMKAQWGGSDPSDIFHNYALDMTSTFWQQIDPTYPTDPAPAPSPVATGRAPNYRGQTFTARRYGGY